MDQWPVLQRFWQRALDPGFTTDPADPVDRWLEEVKVLNRMGLAMETALQFLHHQRPTLDAYRQWLQEQRKDALPPAAAEDVLSEEDLAFWDENGYLVLKDAVSAQQCADARQAIWDFLRASPDVPQSWYRPHEGKRGLMLNFFDHPALDTNRQSNRIYQAYRQLYGSAAIHRTIDKTGFNPPENGSFQFMGSPLHWDVSLVLPIPFRLQGLLYLSDCAAHDGAFHCVPGFHRHIGGWLASLPPGADPKEAVPRLLQAVPVPAKAGDFIIWHGALPHCATPNRGSVPRLVQYLTYLPDADEQRKEWR